jgi:hypothetical protein
MDQFGILIKSYGPDLPYAERLLKSIDDFCEDGIPVAVVVPDEDLAAFAPSVAGRGELLPESLWGDQLVDYRIHGSSPGYINQEIIKVSLWQQGLFANYLCADSETVFIRQFSTSDFMYSEEVPYTFVTEDAELRADPIYEAAYGTTRDSHLVHLREFLKLPSRPYKTTHGMAVLSSRVCENLSNYLTSMSWTWADALELCPYEFSWYNFWLEREQIIPRIEREPIFKTIHLEHQHLELALKGIRGEDLARGYVGVVVNSGFSRQHGHLGFDEPLDHTLGRYVSQRDLARGAVERVLRRLPRVRRILHL